MLFLFSAQSPPYSTRNIPSPPPVLSPMFGGGGGGSALSFTETRDTEALITLEVTYVSALCPSQQGVGALMVASVQFNTLDIIGECVGVRKVCVRVCVCVRGCFCFSFHDFLITISIFLSIVLVSANIVCV